MISRAAQPVAKGWVLRAGSSGQRAVGKTKFLL